MALKVMKEEGVAINDLGGLMMQHLPLAAGDMFHWKKEGMVSEIVENTPFRFVSIRHIGMLKGGQEITEGPEVEKWAGSLENYSFEENSGITTVSIEIDVVPEYKDYFSETWPRALNKLKALAEG